MAADTHIVLPILHEEQASGSRDVYEGELATHGGSVSKSISDRLPGIHVDERSLEETVDAALKLAASIQSQATTDSGFALSSLEVSLGVSATGKVGFLGTGVDVAGSATFTVVLTKAT